MRVEHKESYIRMNDNVQKIEGKKIQSCDYNMKIKTTEKGEETHSFSQRKRK